MKQKWIRIIGITVSALVVWGIVQTPIIDEYVYHLKQNAQPVMKKSDPLYNQIVEKSSNYNVQPKNAVMDPVWKATPGYNGLKVDPKASYEKMKKENNFNPKKLVFHQISPKVHLENLPPAPIYRGNPDKPMVSLTINVAWGNEYLSDMLATLKKHNVKASFFLEGRWVKTFPELAKMIAEAGHEVGNHSYTHPNLKTLSTPKTEEELFETNRVIEATTGVKPKWFAPPSGSFRQETILIANKLQLGTIMWSVDTIDWQKPTKAVLLKRVLTKIHPGAIVLMHPTESSSQALEELILSIKAKGLQLGTITELVDEERLLDNKGRN